MAERRISSAGATRASAPFLEEFMRPAAWVVLDAAETVAQPFYAALDGDHRLCWTDDRDLAQRFATKRAAERFALDRATTDVCIIRQH